MNVHNDLQNNLQSNAGLQQSRYRELKPCVHVSLFGFRNGVYATPIISNQINPGQE